MVMPALAGRTLTVVLDNASGGTVARGMVLIYDTGHDSSFLLSTTLGDKRFCGFAAQAFAISESGRVQVEGACLALIQGAVTRGHYLKISATSGHVEDTGTIVGATTIPPEGSVAVALASGTDEQLIPVRILSVVMPTPISIPTQGQFNADVLDFDTLVDGEFLKRVGTTIVSATPAGGGGGGTFPLGDPDEPPVSPNAMDDEFDDTTGMSGAVNGLNARWAANQGGMTPVWTIPGHIKITPAASATPYNIGIEQVKPGTDYTVRTKVSWGGTVQNRGGGLYVRDHSGGDGYGLIWWYNWHVSAADSILAISWGTFNTSASGTEQKRYDDLRGIPGEIYMEMKYVGTTITFSYSFDGKAWVEFWAMTDPIGHTRVGIFMSDNGANVGKNHIVCDWFRRIA